MVGIRYSISCRRYNSTSREDAILIDDGAEIETDKEYKNKIKKTEKSFTRIRHT
jgi:hypothetical protein